jgi:hypothetical protein
LLRVPLFVPADFRVEGFFAAAVGLVAAVLPPAAFVGDAFLADAGLAAAFVVAAQRGAASSSPPTSRLKIRLLEKCVVLI